MILNEQEAETDGETDQAEPGEDARRPAEALAIGANAPQLAPQHEGRHRSDAPQCAERDHDIVDDIHLCHSFP